MVKSVYPLFLLIFALSACSDDGNRRPGRSDGGVSADGSALDGAALDGTGGGGDSSSRMCASPSPEGTVDTCSDGVDNDCDGQFDCTDIDCSGVGTCPVCGEVNTPLSSPLALPDGVGSDSCTSDAMCPGDQQCFEIPSDSGGSMSECRESYQSTLSFTGFGPATFDGLGDIQSVCVEIEHTWIRDLEIALEAPNGQRIRLQSFLGRMGGEIYFGEPSCSDGTPGIAARYCWNPGAPRASMLEYANSGGRMNSVSGCGFGDSDSLPPGDYSSADPWEMLIGAPLNGDWTLSVTDLWGIDKGYLFNWSINFDPRTVEDCSIPLI